MNKMVLVRKHGSYKKTQDLKQKNEVSDHKYPRKPVIVDLFSWGPKIVRFRRHFNIVYDIFNN